MRLTGTLFTIEINMHGTTCTLPRLIVNHRSAAGFFIYTLYSQNSFLGLTFPNIPCQNKFEGILVA
jgi:hypothetical protein